MFPFLNCCAAAAVQRLGKFLVCLVPGGDALVEAVEFGSDVWERWKKQKPAEADRREELQALAHASPERVEAAVQAAILTEAAGQPAVVQRKLTTYLTQVQVTVRSTVCRGDDHNGQTVPPDLRLDSAKDLQPFLPPQLPRFEPGDLHSPPVPTPVVPPPSGTTPIRFACPVCKTAMRASAQDVGQKLNCPKCGQRIQIPPPPRGTILAESLPAEKEPILERRPPRRGEPARSAWDFDQESGGVRRPPRRGIPGWVWLAGGAAAVVVGVMVALATRGGPKPTPPDASPVASKGPGSDDRPKDADKAKDADKTKDTNPNRKKDKKDKTDTPEKPAPLPKPLPTSWKSLANMPTARSLLAAVSGPDGRIYAIGGENASGSLGIVEVYDPSTNKWTTVASMPTARNHLAATMGPDNLIYAIGGVSGDPKIVEAYNPSTNKWTTVAPIPTARHGLAAVTGPDGRIYAIGGGGPGRSLNTVEAYDPTTNTWATVANLPTARVYLAAATGPDGRIYAIGGFQEGDKRLDTVEAYDTKTNTWSAVASMTTARNAHAVATGPDGRIYAIGGHTVGGMPNTVEAYNPNSNTWTPVENMPTVRGQLAATTGRDGRIYVIGGGDGRFLDIVEALSFSTSKP